MCPACFTTAALIAAGASSSGGLTALVIRALGAKSGTENVDRQSEPEVEPCSTTQSCNQEVS